MSFQVHGHHTFRGLTGQCGSHKRERQQTPARLHHSRAGEKPAQHHGKAGCGPVKRADKMTPDYLKILLALLDKEDNVET